LLVASGAAAIAFKAVLDSTAHYVTRVACIGDSITEITGYPRELQALLGDDYAVGNFGASGATVLLHTHMPYRYQMAFFRARNFMPHIAVVMLGTNDARVDHFQAIDNFTSDYKEIINRLKALKSNPKIFLVLPPPLFDNEFDLRNENLVDGIIPRIEQLANELDLPVIDVYSALKDHPEYFPDGVHPNSKGATVIAATVYEAIVSNQAS